jgi:hypothetical protein
MDDSKKLSSNEWGVPNQGRTPESSNGAEQADKGISVASILAKDSDRRVQAVDINGYIKGPWMMMPPQPSKGTNRPNKKE